MSRLLPDSDTPIVVNGQVVKETEASFLAANPRTNGNGNVIVAGTVATGDVLQMIFTANFLPGGSVTVSATAAASDTAEIMAEKLAAAIEANATLQGFGVSATNAKAQVNVTWPGPLSTFVVISTHTTAAETFTVTQLTGGSGPVIPSGQLITGDYFKFAWNGQILKFKPNCPVNVGADLLAALAATQAPVM